MKYVIALLGALFLGSLCYAGDRAEGYNNWQYQVITSSGITNITWTRQVQRVDIVQISTHTVYVHPYAVMATSRTVAGGQTLVGETMDRLVGIATPYYLLDSGTARTSTTLNVKSNDFSVFVDSTTGIGIAGNIRIWGWGW
jgi:hypothetical protein